MKEEHYNKLVEKVGKEKADNIKEQLEKDRLKNLEEVKEREEHEKKLLEAAIPKEELVGGAFYLGVRFRNHGLAQWDEKLGVFLTINYQFEPFLERIQHFADTIETGFDGFIPFEKIDKNKYYHLIKQTKTEDIKEEIEKLKKE
jgi:hypothetical protein